MRQWVAGGVLLAFVAVFAQAPWMHVHEHHYDADHDREHAAFTIHGHDLPASTPGTRWRARSADEDARPIGRVTAARDDGAPTNLEAPQLGPVAPVEPVWLVWFSDAAPRSHGPPGLGRLIPRAPPA